MSNKVSAKGTARRMKAEDAKLRKGHPTADSFQNFAAKLGIGTDNMMSGSTYGFNPITRVRTLLEWIHRGSWLGGVAIDLVADDMTRAGVEVQGDLEPDQIEQIETEITRLGVWNNINDTIKWSRLYGGALGVILIDGQDNSTPLRVDTVGPKQFRGVLSLDRWMVEPTLEDLVQEYGPDYGLPKYYRVVGDAPGLRSQKIHHSRCIRMEGIRLPYWQRVMENMWGISVLERLYDRMVAFDSATTGAAQLVYRSWVRTYKIENLREIVAAGGAALDGLVRYVDMMARFQGIEGVTLLDAKDEFATNQHSAFGGLADVMLQMGQQISGSLQIPLVRLFGQSPAGLNSTGESDLRTYYDGINQQQKSKLHVGVTRVYRCAARSLKIEPPKGYGISFRPLWLLTDKEKADIAASVTSTVVEAQESGLVDQPTAMKELRQSSRITGIWSNVSDEAIEEAEQAAKEMPPEPELGGGPSMGGPQLVGPEKAGSGPRTAGASGKEQPPRPKARELQAARGAKTLYEKIDEGKVPGIDSSSIRKYGTRDAYAGSWIGVDLDGTLAVWQEGVSTVEEIGEPLQNLVNEVKQRLKEGQDMRIFTARVADPATEDYQRALIEQWCARVFGKVLPITCRKDRWCIEIWDDHARHVAANTGTFDHSFNHRATHDAEGNFEENKHPRKKDGKFAPKGGGESGGGEVSGGGYVVSPLEEEKPTEIHGMQKGSHKTAGSFAMAMIKEGKYSNSQIAEATSQFFGTKTNNASIIWYKSKLKQDSPEYKAAKAAKEAAVKANDNTIAEAAKKPMSAKQLQQEAKKLPKHPHSIMVKMYGYIPGKYNYVKVDNVPGNTPVVVDQVKKWVSGLYPNGQIHFALEYNPNKPQPPEGIEDLSVPDNVANDMEQAAYKQAEIEKKKEELTQASTVSSEMLTPLSHTQKESLKQYTNGAYSQLNSRLRSGQPLNPTQAQVAFNMDQAIKNSRLSKDGVIYRGIANPTAFFGPELKEGSAVLDNGFLSCTKKFGTAQSFSSGGMVARFVVKKGDRGIDVSGFSLHGGENEIVLPRGSMFVIKKVIGKIVECEYVSN